MVSEGVDKIGGVNDILVEGALEIVLCVQFKHFP